MFNLAKYLSNLVLNQFIVSARRGDLHVNQYIEHAEIRNSWQVRLTKKLILNIYIMLCFCDTFHISIVYWKLLEFNQKLVHNETINIITSYLSRDPLTPSSTAADYLNPTSPLELWFVSRCNVLSFRHQVWHLFSDFFACAWFYKVPSFYEMPGYISRWETDLRTCIYVNSQELLFQFGEKELP